jgi:hypothetical protein
VVPDAGASPNASILPAPLAEPPDLLDASVDGGQQGMAADPAGRLFVADAGGAPPEPLRPEVVMAVEAPSGKDLGGVTLDAAWRWRDVPAPPRAPEVSLEGIKEAQKATALTWKIDLSDSGRMRIAVTSHAQAFPRGSEIRSRADRWGHIVLWPNMTRYRVVPVGALRTAIGERRVDMTPLSVGTVLMQGEGRRLSVATRKVEIASTVGTIKLELGKLADAGDGGALLCRALVEMGGVDPKTPACVPGEVPIAASYAWQEGGGISFEATTVVRRIDLPPGEMVVPPPGAQHVTEGLPAAPDGIFLTREQLAAFRSTALPASPQADRTAPAEGFIAANHSDMLMYLLVDGVPSVAVPASAERYVIGPQRGKYSLAWRSFLGDRVQPAKMIELPARIAYGQIADAGAPDGG